MNITRRSVLKAIGAALVAPCVNLRREIDREALLRQFCADYESYRFDLRNPFEVEGITYATDARFIVRTPLESPIHNGERKIPDVLTLYRDNFKPRQWQRFFLPSPNSKVLRNGRDSTSGTCPTCGNHRIKLTEYPSNDWLMSGDAHDIDYDCDDNSHRDPSCQMCHGKAWYGPYILDVCGVPMDYTRLKTIATLPDVMVCDGVYFNPRDKVTDKCVLFASDGFEGISMGMDE